MGIFAKDKHDSLINCGYVLGIKSVINNLILNRFSLVFLLLVLVNSCSSTKKIEKSYDVDYNKQLEEIEADFLIYHLNADESSIYYSINNEDVLYKKTDSSGLFTATLKLHYKILASQDAKSVLDSGSILVVDKLKELNPAFIHGFFNISCKVGSERFLDIQLKDQNRNKQNKWQQLISKEITGTEQDFLLKGQNGKVKFSNHFDLGASVQIENSRCNKNELFVQCLKMNEALATPPFIENGDEKEIVEKDSTYTIQSDNEKNFNLKLNNTGMYLLKCDRTTQGKSLFVSSTEFPQIVTHRQMIMCARYILKEDEYLEMFNSKDPQKEIEQFWLSIAGNQSRAKNLIKVYYGRVQQANELFTSNTEGWRTDRGMVYIVFGSPHKVHKTSESELWIYGVQESPEYIIFKFEKKNNPYANNDFKLVRSSVFKEPWYNAVSAWREGKLNTEN